MTNSTTKFSNSTTAYAHLYSNMTQLWTDKLNNIKIQFSYLPEKPTADDTIQLQFSIQNLQTGIHLKDITAKVTIFNDPIYKYASVSMNYDPCSHFRDVPNFSNNGSSLSSNNSSDLMKT
jgi:hypothetical protein